MFSPSDTAFDIWTGIDGTIDNISVKKLLTGTDAKIINRTEKPTFTKTFNSTTGNFEYTAATPIVKDARAYQTKVTSSAENTRVESITTETKRAL